MDKPLTFQQVILRLQTFWAEHDCLIWQVQQKVLVAYVCQCDYRRGVEYPALAHLQDSSTISLASY